MASSPRAHPRAATILAAVAVLLVVPGVDAQTVLFDTVEVKMSPSAFDADLKDQAIVDTDALSLRGYIDENFGDAADGIITVEEYEAYRAAEITRFNDQLNNPIATGLFGDLQVNEGRARSIRVLDVTLSDNVIGSTADNDTIYRGVSAQLAFAGTEKTRVPVTFAQDFRVPFRIIEMEWRTAFFHGAEVWEIDSSTTDPVAVKAAFWQDTQFVVPYERSGNFSSKDIPLTFEIFDSSAEKPKTPAGSKKGSPGFGVEVALLGVIGLAALLRRRF